MRHVGPGDKTPVSSKATRRPGTDSLRTRDEASMRYLVGGGPRATHAGASRSFDERIKNPLSVSSRREVRELRWVRELAVAIAKSYGEWWAVKGSNLRPTD